MPKYFHYFIISIIILFPIIFTKENDKDIQKKVILCNKYNCPKNRGICNEDNVCVCLNGYETVDDLSLGNFDCNYKKKSKLIAFLLEFVLGFGAGHFYMGHITLSTIKMIYTSLTCLLFCQYNSIQKITEIKRFAVPLERILLCGWAVWQIIDGLLISFGYYKDGNGYELRSW